MTATDHCIARFRERVNPTAPEWVIPRLCRDAQPPTARQLAAIRKAAKGSRVPAEDVRVLGSIVFLVRGAAIVTCWRCDELRNASEVTP